MAAGLSSVIRSDIGGRFISSLPVQSIKRHAHETWLRTSSLHAWPVFYVRLPVCLALNLYLLSRALPNET